jgi:hypothetical protein
MFELSIFLRDKLVGRSTFESDEVRIGRNQDNEVRIDNPALSRYHASIEAVSGIYLVKDYGSQNGTYVNGEKVVGRRGLNDGDRITVGKFTLIFRTEKQAAVQQAMVTDHASYAVAGETIVMRAPAAEARERPCPWVGYLETTDGAIFPPPRHPLNRDYTFIGTSAACQLTFDKAGAPRVACVVRGWSGYGLVAIGPNVARNSEAVDGVVPLQDGDMLRLGGVHLRFFAGRAGEY